VTAHFLEQPDRDEEATATCRRAPGDDGGATADGDEMRMTCGSLVDSGSIPGPPKRSAR
jgi:hypothetical protein